MLVAFVVAHFAIASLAVGLMKLLGTRSFLVTALVPAGAFVWFALQGPAITSGEIVSESWSWIPTLGVDLTFRMGLVQWILALIVTGIGALILFYCRWYFSPSASATRCLGLMAAFAGAMIGLVTADNLMLLYVFWELTTVFSYLLVGNDSTRQANRSAALTALIVTTFGGLAMLVGIVTLRLQTGTFSLSGILAAQPTGPLATVGALLLLVGALSKSAQVPFHFWLPGAMAAATPVSAYLHAATMVKAGVYLVAVLAPTFAHLPLWRITVMVLGAATLIVGGWRSLRQVDLKLLLAYGTVSQLGFLVLLCGIGTRSAALAGIAMTIAHALFKATLFLTVGVIDKATGTRDLTKLSGLARRMPVLTVAATLAAASMAGLPPLLGFLSKEAAFESLLNLFPTGDGTQVSPALSVVLLVTIVVGSALTMAYSLRFVWGAFADKPGVVTESRPVGRGLPFSPIVLGFACLVAGFTGPTLTGVLTPYALTADGADGHGLALWHGFSPPLAMSALAIAGGILLFWQRDATSRLQETFPTFVPADEWYKRSMKALDVLGVEVTSRFQQGSLSVYVSTILGFVVVVVGGPLLLTQSWPDRINLYDTPGQVLTGAVMVTAAVLAAMSRGRVRAVVLVGVTGYGTAVLFLLHGAPDLALTQTLVETVTLIVFLLLLRYMPRYFTNRPLAATRWWRVLLAVLVGAMLTMFALVAAGSRTATPASEPLYEAAYKFGYGRNIVNVILVDTRAWDTLGELSVLVIAATGVASLIFLRSRVQNVHRPKAPRAVRATQQPGVSVWLRGTENLDPQSRSLVFEVVTRLTFGVMVTVSIWLLLAGHNWPGGGFAAGLVTGMALMVRYLAAGREELNDAAPIDAGRLLGAGLLISVLSALAPTFVGGRIFQSFDMYLRIPGLQTLPTPFGDFKLLGEVHLVSSTVFDVGVYLIVLGVLLDYARSLGSGIDLQLAQSRVPLPKPDSTVAIRPDEEVPR